MEMPYSECTTWRNRTLPQLWRETGRGSTSSDSQRTALPFISALNVQRSLSAVKTHALICPLQIPAPTRFGAGKACPQGLLPTLFRCLGCLGKRLGRLAHHAAAPWHPTARATARSCQLCSPEPPHLQGEVPPPHRTTQGVRLHPNSRAALSGQ